MSGDIDSRISDIMDATDSEPGANDNASGLAGTLEAARVLTRYRFAGSIVYAALSAEEQGLDGGTILAQWIQQRGWRLTGVLNNDMIGNVQGIDGITDNSTARVFSDGTPPTETEQERNRRRVTGGEVDGVSRQLARYVKRIADRYVPALDVWMIYRLDRFGRGGHHKPFADLGYPAVRFMETHENYDRQHQNVRVENGVALRRRPGGRGLRLRAEDHGRRRGDPRGAELGAGAAARRAPRRRGASRRPCSPGPRPRTRRTSPGTASTGGAPTRRPGTTGRTWGWRRATSSPAASWTTTSSAWRA